MFLEGNPARLFDWQELDSIRNAKDTRLMKKE